MASSCSLSYILLPFAGPTLKQYDYFFSCKPVSFASISALCVIGCNKSFVKQINLVMPYKHCFLLVKLVTATFVWKKSIIEQNFQFENLLFELNFIIFYNNIVK